MDLILEQIKKTKFHQQSDSHHYTVASATDIAYKIENITYCCFGGMLKSGLKKVYLVSRHDPFGGYFSDVCLKERKELFEDIYKKYPHFNVFKGEVLNLGNVYAIEVNIDIPSSFLARGLFLFRGINRMMPPVFEQMKEGRFTLIDKVIMAYVMECNENRGNSRTKRIYKYADHCPWREGMKLSDIKRWLAATESNQRPITRQSCFNLKMDSSNYKDGITREFTIKGIKFKYYE